MPRIQQQHGKLAREDDKIKVVEAQIAKTESSLTRYKTELAKAQSESRKVELGQAVSKAGLTIANMQTGINKLKRIKTS